MSGDSRTPLDPDESPEMRMSGLPAGRLGFKLAALAEYPFRALDLDGRPFRVTDFRVEPIGDGQYRHVLSYADAEPDVPVSVKVKYDPDPDVTQLASEIAAQIGRQFPPAPPHDAIVAWVKEQVARLGSLAEVRRVALEPPAVPQDPDVFAWKALRPDADAERSTARALAESKAIACRAAGEPLPDDVLAVIENWTSELLDKAWPGTKHA